MMIYMNIREYVTSYTQFSKWWLLKSLKNQNYNFPQLNLYLSYSYVFTTKCIFFNVLSLHKPVTNDYSFNRGLKWLPIMAVNLGNKNCSCNIINYFKAFSTTINMVKPTSCNLWLGLYEKW